MTSQNQDPKQDNATPGTAWNAAGALNADDAAQYLPGQDGGAATIEPPHDDSEARKLIELFIEDIDYKPAAAAWDAYEMTPEQATEILANEPPAVMRIGGVRVNSAGDLSEVIGAAKSRKTTYVKNLARQILHPHPDNVIQCDIERPTVCFFDTEQSKLHAAKTYRDITKGLTEDERNRLKYLRLRSEGYCGRLEAVTSCILKKRPTLAIIDGLADLMHDTNSNTEAPQIMALLMAIAEASNAHIKVVMHNSAANLGKGRGNAGSEAGRKCESVESVTIDKDGKSESLTTSVVAPSLTRNAPFPKIYVTHNPDGSSVLTADYTPPTADDFTMCSTMLKHAAEMFPTVQRYNKIQLQKAHNAARKSLGGGDPLTDNDFKKDLQRFVEAGFLEEHKAEKGDGSGVKKVYTAPDDTETDNPGSDGDND